MGNIPSRHHSLIYSDHGVLRRSGPRREKKSTYSYPDYFEIESLAPDVHNTKKIYNIDRKKASTSSQDTHRASNRSNSTSSSSLNSLKSRSKTRHHHSANNDSSAISRNYDYGTCYFEIVNGRRYMICDDSHFFLPCDDDESDRLVISVIA